MKKYKFQPYWYSNPKRKIRRILTDEQGMEAAKNPDRETDEGDGATGKWKMFSGDVWKVLTHEFTSAKSTVVGIFNHYLEKKMPK